MKEKINKKKKKQHYVPQCYLKAWTIPNTNQINVYDKELRVQRINNIIDVASENYFYDIDFMKAISKEERQFFGVTEEEFKMLSESQVIENTFAEEIESEFSIF